MKKNNSKIIAAIPGEGLSSIPNSASYFFISQSHPYLYNISFVKSKYKNIKKLQTWDVMILRDYDLRRLLKWGIEFDPSKWETDKFYSQECSILVECDCHNEVMIVYFDKEERLFYFEIYDNYWCKRKYRRKLSSEFAVSVKTIKNYFYDILKSLPEEE